MRISWRLFSSYSLALTVFCLSSTTSCFANSSSAGSSEWILISHRVSNDTFFGVDSEFDDEAYGHTHPTVKSQESNYQLKELFGLGAGRQFFGFGFPDSTSNWDAESLHRLYEEVMNRQILEEPMYTEDLSSPFDQFIGN